MEITDIVKKAHELAVKAQANAYAKYSKHPVGAAVKAKGSEQIFVGCNMENAVNGASICAEPVAIAQLTAHQGKSLIEFIVVASDHKKGVAPCGVCRQVLLEFSDENTKVYTANLQEIQNCFTVFELMPERYDEEAMISK